jgi:hypothetical protein
MSMTAIRWPRKTPPATPVTRSQTRIIIDVVPLHQPMAQRPHLMVATPPDQPQLHHRPSDGIELYVDMGATWTRIGWLTAIADTGINIQVRGILQAGSYSQIITDAIKTSPGKVYAKPIINYRPRDVQHRRSGSYLKRWQLSHVVLTRRSGMGLWPDDATRIQLRSCLPGV